MINEPDYLAEFTRLADNCNKRGGFGRSSVNENYIYMDATNEYGEISCLCDKRYDPPRVITLIADSNTESRIFLWHNPNPNITHRSQYDNKVDREFDGSVWLRYFEISRYDDFIKIMHSILKGESANIMIDMDSKTFINHFDIPMEQVDGTHL
jgi:hypothetical protein